jgi:hypothetical protein
MLEFYFSFQAMLKIIILNPNGIENKRAQTLFASCDQTGGGIILIMVNQCVYMLLVVCEAPQPKAL